MQDLVETAPAASPAPPQAAHALMPGRERFIPVSRYGLRVKLVAMLTEAGGDAKAWGRALDCLAAWRHHQHRQRLHDLLENYLPFSPDSDTAHLVELNGAERDKAQRNFIAGIEKALAQANFVRLSKEDMDRTAAAKA